MGMAQTNLSLPTIDNKKVTLSFCVTKRTWRENCIMKSTELFFM